MEAIKITIKQKKMKSTFTEAWERLWSDTPKFFNKMKVVGGSLIATGTALALVPNIPPILVTVSGYVITAGGIMVAMSQLAVEPPKDSK